MKDLISGLWNGPKTTVAALLIASATAIVENQAGVDLPGWLVLTLTAISAGLATFQAPKK